MDQVVGDIYAFECGAEPCAAEHVTLDDLNVAKRCLSRVADQRLDRVAVFEQLWQ